MSDVIKEPQPLDVTEAHEGDDFVLAVSGELDPHTAPILAQHLGEAGEQGSGRVILDLSGVSFVDSSGLRVLIEAQQSLTDSNREFAVRNPSEAVKRLLKITGLDEHLGRA